MAVANPYLRDNYGPVRTEETVTDLPVTGTLPDSLNGRYLRNGPNPIGTPDPATYHWFTGEGMVHGIRLGEGAARWYRNRWVRSADVAAALGEPVHAGPVVEGMDFAANTNVIAPRATDLHDRRGRRAPLRADRGAGDRRAVRLRRHPSRRVHRPPQA